MLILILSQCNYLINESNYPRKVVSSIDDATERILAGCGDPLNLNSWTRRGMVVGSVQSGKTSNYIGLITKAADYGYKVIIVIAGIHEMCTYVTKEINNEYTKKTLINNYNKILITLLPIIPHFASECLEVNQFKINQTWPSIDEEKLIDEKIKIVVQINGKKRALIDAERNITQENLLKIINNNNSINKYLINKNVLKVIFIMNKIINIIL